MRFKLDENLPESLVAALSSRGHDVDTVRSEGLAGRDDSAIWSASQEEGRFFVTQDLDFSDARRFAPGTHCGLMLVRLRDPGRRALVDCIVRVLGTEVADSLDGCVVVVTERKTRVARPRKEVPDRRA